MAQVNARGTVILCSKYILDKSPVLKNHYLLSSNLFFMDYSPNTVHDMLDYLRDYEKNHSTPEHIKGILNELQIETKERNIKNDHKQKEPILINNNVEQVYCTLVHSQKILDKYKNIDQFVDLMKEYNITFNNDIKQRDNYTDVYVYRDAREYSVKIPRIKYLNIALTILSYHGYHFEDKTYAYIPDGCIGYTNRCNDPHCLNNPSLITDMVMIKNKPDDYFYSYEIQFPEKRQEKYGIYDFILLCTAFQIRSEDELKRTSHEIIIKRTKHNKL